MLDSVWVESRYAWIVRARAVFSGNDLAPLPCWWERDAAYPEEERP